MPEIHARFSPSSAERIIHCPPSLVASESFPDEESVFASEGSDAHALAAYKLSLTFGPALPDPHADLKSVDQEMEDMTDSYVDYVKDLYGDSRTLFNQNPMVFIEQLVYFGRFVADGFGTADCIVISDEGLHVIDLKYGRGVEVSAEDNDQLKCYALGALEIFGHLYDVGKVVLHIFQPRMGNVSEFTLSKEDLYSWAENVLKPAAAKAIKGEGEFCSGRWCRFCRAKSICRKRADDAVHLIGSGFEAPALLTDEEITALLPKLDDLVSWANGLKDYCLKTALNGKEWPGWKVVAGRSIRRYSDAAAVIKAVTDAGYDPMDRSLMGITDLTRLLGKDMFDKLVGPFIIKPEGRPTLVPEDDRRPGINSAADDFKEE